MSGAKRSQAEVIQEWADFDANGASFERGRMEANIQSICFNDPAGVPASLKDKHKGLKIKGSDVLYLTNEFLVDQDVAGAALVEAQGDVTKATQLLLRNATM